MKKILFFLLLIPLLSNAQEQADTTRTWKTGGLFSVNFSQVSLTNWIAGGKSSASGVFMVNAFINYENNNISWDNTVDLAYGFLKEEENAPLKSDDKIDLNSKLGIKANERWNYSVLVNFKSQFMPGYAYPNTNDPISKFLAPGYLNLAAGMDYKTEKVSVFMSPVTGKFTFVTDDELSAQGAFGIDPGKTVRSEIGAFVKFSGKTEVVKNVSVQTKLDLFSNYLHNPQNIDVDWNVLINMKVNEFLSANLVTHLKYDDDISIPIDNNGDGTIDESGPRIQFMEMFGAGLSFKF